MTHPNLSWAENFFTKVKVAQKLSRLPKIFIEIFFKIRFENAQYSVETASLVFKFG